jgi:hypothetical protein
MAKCGICSKKKGKRYCSPIDKVICPVCCAESRGQKIDCNEDCRYLEGAVFEKKRKEEKKYAQLMSEVGHGQFDDIFQQPPVAEMAYDIESFIRDVYIRGNVEITDTIVSEAYKAVYAIHFERKQIELNQLDDLTKGLLNQYETNSPIWKENLDEEMIGRVYLRLMISTKKMSGGRMGNYGYLNYLKNNLGQSIPDGKFIAEDKFGNKSIHETLE